MVKNNSGGAKPEAWEEYSDNFEKPRSIPENEDVVDINGRLLNHQPAHDKLISAEVQMQVGNGVQTGKVTQRAVDPDGHTVGKYDDNPSLNSLLYEVEVDDGLVREYAANIIAQNMLSQVDEDGLSLIQMDSIIDHRKDPDVAIAKEDGYVVTGKGSKKLRKTTLGWQLLIQ